MKTNTERRKTKQNQRQINTATSTTENQTKKNNTRKTTIGNQHPRNRTNRNTTKRESTGLKNNTIFLREKVSSETTCETREKQREMNKTLNFFLPFHLNFLFAKRSSTESATKKKRNTHERERRKHFVLLKQINLSSKSKTTYNRKIHSTRCEISNINHKVIISFKRKKLLKTNISKSLETKHSEIDE